MFVVSQTQLTRLLRACREDRACAQALLDAARDSETKALWSVVVRQLARPATAYADRKT